MSILIAFLLILHLILCIFKISIDIKSKRFGLITGYYLSIIYFIIIPLLYYTINGELNLNDATAPATYYYLESDYDTQANILLFLISFLVANFIIIIFENIFTTSLNMGTRKYDPYVGSMLNIAWLFSFGFLILYYFIVMKGADHWYHAKGEFFENYGTVGVIFGFLLFGSKMYFLSEFFKAIDNDQNKLKLAFYALSIIAAELYITGNRVFIFVFAYTFLFYFILKKKYKYLLWLLIVSVLSAFVLGCYSVFRSYLYSEGFEVALDKTIEFIATNSVIYDYVFKAIFETVNINILMSLYKHADFINLDLTHLTFIKPFIFFIPRSLLENKIESVTVIAGQMLDGREGLSLVTLLPGEAILNFGYLFFIFLPFVVIIFNRFVLLVNKKSINNWALLGYGLLLMRFPFSDVFIQYIATSLLITFGNRLSKLKLKKINK